MAEEFKPFVDTDDLLAWMNREANYLQFNKLESAAAVRGLRAGIDEIERLQAEVESAHAVLRQIANYRPPRDKVSDELGIYMDLASVRGRLARTYVQDHVESTKVTNNGGPGPSPAKRGATAPDRVPPPFCYYCVHGLPCEHHVTEKNSD